MATLASPRAPDPKTSAFPPGGGGLRTMAWNDTENGSASTAASSVTSSGTGMSMEEWAASCSAQAPGAPVTTPMWTPGPMSPLVKDQHRLRSPAWQGGHRGVMPRGAQLSHGLSTTRWPTSTSAGLGSEGDHLGHHLVSGHVGKGGEGGHRVVDVPIVELAEDQLGVRPTHTGEDRPGHDPVRVDGTGVVHLVQAERERRQPCLELVGGHRP